MSNFIRLGDIVINADQIRDVHLHVTAMNSKTEQKEEGEEVTVMSPRRIAVCLEVSPKQGVGIAHEPHAALGGVVGGHVRRADQPVRGGTG